MNTTLLTTQIDQVGKRAANPKATSLLRHIFNATSHGIVAIQADFRIVLANRAFANLINRDESDVLGAYCYDILQGEQCNTDACPLHLILAGESRLDSECCIFDSNGCKIHCRVNSTPHLNSDGETIGMVQEFHDLEETRLLEQNLDLKSRRLEIQESLLKDREAALRQVMLQITAEKRNTEKRIVESIERIIVPLVHKAKTAAEGDLKTRLELVETSLAELVSPLIDSQNRCFSSLTPRELEICHLIRQGLRSKEIASLLHTAEGTVEQQRKKIRRKLNLKGSSRNLASYLQTR